MSSQTQPFITLSSLSFFLDKEASYSNVISDCLAMFHVYHSPPAFNRDVRLIHNQQCNATLSTEYPLSITHCLKRHSFELIAERLEIPFPASVAVSHFQSAQVIAGQVSQNLNCYSHLVVGLIRRNLDRRLFGAVSLLSSL